MIGTAGKGASTFALMAPYAGMPGRKLELTWSDQRGRPCLRISGWTPAELRELRRLSAHERAARLSILPSELVGRGDLHHLQPLAGAYEVAAEAVCFIPRFPFTDGMSYTLHVASILERDQANEVETWTITRPVRTATPTTEVVAIYPSAEEVPVNLLRLYVHFSNPMSEGWAKRAIQLRRGDNGEPLHDVFLTEPELWDPDRRRLTLLLEPGRIKRGLGPHEEAGYPLIEGVATVVAVDPSFPDAEGRPLRARAERSYVVGSAVRAHVNPKHWRCATPTVGSTEPLFLEFDRPLDHALVERSIWVNDAMGQPLPGRASVGSMERTWRFEPELAWQDGRYEVVIAPRLEDVAGNSLVRVFDRDLDLLEDAPSDAEHYGIEFTCRRT